MGRIKPHGRTLMGDRHPLMITAAISVLTAALASCTGSATPAPNPDGAMVIEVSVGGGLAPPAVRVGDSLPRIWIAGDGRYLQKTSDGSADPALITLQERRIPETAVAGLLDGARDAGLLEDDPDYGDPRFADAMVTRVIVVSGGQRKVVRISALGYPNLGLTDRELTARERLSEFLDLLNHPERIAGVSDSSPYRPAAVAVFTLGTEDSPTASPSAIWPLGDLRGAGETTDWPDRSARCLVVAGDQADAVATAASGKVRGAPWQAPDGLWNIALRPLLPDERSCGDVIE